MSNEGRVRSLDRVVNAKDGRKMHIKGRYIAPGICKNGYGIVTLWRNNRCEYSYIHKLVATAFLDKPTTEKRLVVDHIDGDKTNNHVGNLEWVTYSENNQRAYDSQLKVGCGRKLNRRQVEDIRASKKSLGCLAEKYSVSDATICLIKQRKIYKEVS